MADINFPNVNTKIRRSGTTWEEVEGFIEDVTMSGKPKRRFATSQGKRPFQVKMRFSKDEYDIFTEWYNLTCRRGTYTFAFPCIDGDKTTYKEYRFAKGGKPKYTNVNGNLIECTMTWEEL